MNVKGLNHAVLRVRDLDRSVEFYHRVLGFEEIARAGSAMAFMRAPGSQNHHDLGFLRVGNAAPAADPKAVGLFHLAWQVTEIEELRDVLMQLRSLGSLTGASDHGATKSIYGEDPDGNEFEVMWLV
ncbi:MAG: VOC family protein, partial [Candidatus Eremiobacteraeota bacterium]|nr:VOC family protein [Candidatus Eremiobacteraeota bacterium]